MELQTDFAQLDSTFRADGVRPDFIHLIPVQQEDIALTVQDGKRELLRITPVGDVIAPDLEAASEAGKIFVKAIRDNFPKR